MFIIAPLVEEFGHFYSNAAMNSGQCWNGKNPEGQEAPVCANTAVPS
jgi:hypothetical protein